MVEWAGTVILTTPRLLLRTYRRDDLPPYAALNAHPEVVRYLGGTALSRAESDAIAEWAQQEYEREGIGLLAVERRQDARFLGMCGLHHQDWSPDDIEVAWRLGYEFWGQGYATEAASAWLDHAFGVLDLPRVISITEPANTRSVAVMERLGLTFDHAAELEGEEADPVPFQAVIYAISAREWRALPHRGSTARRK